MKKNRMGFKVAVLLGTLLFLTGSAFAKPSFRTSGQNKKKGKTNVENTRKTDKKSDTKTDKKSDKKTDSNSGKKSSPTVTSISDKISASNEELAIIVEINLMRSNPREYAEKYIKPRITASSSSYWTSCVSDMSKITSLGEFTYAEGLYQVSKAHSTTQGKTTQTGHTRTNGESWSTVIDRYCKKYSSVGENISYGPNNARDIVIQLLVDDGVSSLGHRKNLLSKEYTSVGVSLDTHKYYRYMCVMNFASGWVDK